jgi:hypothetical protein
MLQVSTESKRAYAAIYKAYDYNQLVIIPISQENQLPKVIDDMKTRIDTLQGNQNDARRLAIYEPVSANI